MIRLVEVHPCTDGYARRRRLEWLSLLTLAFGVLLLWNPVEQPGPTWCPLRNAVALPCPLCGCSRGVALSLRGDWLEATRHNLLAVPVFVLLVSAWLKWAVEFSCPCRIEFFAGTGLGRAVKWGVPLCMMLGWVYLLVYRREDTFATSWLGRLWEMF